MELNHTPDCSNKRCKKGIIIYNDNSGRTCKKCNPRLNTLINLDDFKSLGFKIVMDPNDGFKNPLMGRFERNVRPYTSQIIEHWGEGDTFIDYSTENSSKRVFEGRITNKEELEVVLRQVAYAIK